MKNKIPLKLLHAYQTARKNDGKHYCKYIPSCSNYSIGCYKKFNFFKATLLTIWRLLRCNPFSKGGYDPVPLSKKEKIELEQRTKEILEKSFDATAYVVHHI